MLAKAVHLPADQIIIDLEDSVAPTVKEEARVNALTALGSYDFTRKTVVLRANGVQTRWCYRDIVDVVERCGRLLDCIMIPKVRDASHVLFVANLLHMIEDSLELPRRIGIEAQIETAEGLTNVDEIAAASERLETLVFGPGDMAATLNMPHSTLGQIIDNYPGDHWHAALVRVLVAARSHGLQVIEGPYAIIRDPDGFREVATRSRQLGYDGKWVLHPEQIALANEIYSD